MADKKVQMPTSTAGLTRYFEDYRSKLEFKPGTVIILSVIVILITIILHIYGSSVLGL
jgi:preprotein translocase subunit Sec61beta